MSGEESHLSLNEINSLLDEVLARMDDPKGDEERARLKAESERAIECLHLAVTDLVGAHPGARTARREPASSR